MPYPGYGRTDWLSTLQATDLPRITGRFIAHFDITAVGLLPSSAHAFPQQMGDGHFYVPSLLAPQGFPAQVAPLIAFPLMDTRGWDNPRPWGKALRALDAHIDLNYFDPLFRSDTEYLNQWDDQFLLSQALPFATISFEDGTPNTVSGVRSRFSLPTHPLMCFALWHGDPQQSETPEEDSPVVVTEIKFGISTRSAFVLRLSSTAAPTVSWRHDTYTGGQWKFLERTGVGAGMDMEGDRWIAGEQSGMRLLWIGAFADGIAVGEKALTEGVEFFSFPALEPTPETWGDSVSRIFVEPGPFEISHMGGKWRFAFIPIYMPGLAYMISPVYPLPYPWNANAAVPDVLMLGMNVFDMQPDGSLERARGSVLEEVLAGAYGFDVTGDPVFSTTKPDDRLYQYGVFLQTACMVPPVTAGGGFGANQANPLTPNTPLDSFWAFRSPEVYGARYSRYCSSIQNATPEYMSVALKGGTFTQPEGQAGHVANVAFDNQLGQVTHLLDQAPRNIVVSGAWKRNDGTLDPPNVIFNGYLGDAEVEQAAGRTTLQADAFDLGQVLRDATSVGDWPAFDGWPLRSDSSSEDPLTVWHFIFHTLGFQGQVYVEDLAGPGSGGFQKGIPSLNWGPRGKCLWVCDQGKSIASFVSEIAMYYACAGVWSTPAGIVVGCPYCRSARTYSNWNKHNGPASWGCFMADLARTQQGYAGVDFPLYLDRTSAKELYLGRNAHHGFAAVADDPRQFYHIAKISRGGLALDANYANETTITGPSYISPDHDSATTAWVDWPSIQGTGSLMGDFGRALGRRKTKAYEFEWANSDQIRRRLAWMLGPAHATTPETWSVVIPFAPHARRGMVFSIAGGAHLGVDGKCFRITGVGHDNPLAGNPQCTTLLGTFCGYYASRAAWEEPPEEEEPDE